MPNLRPLLRRLFTTATPSTVESAATVSLLNRTFPSIHDWISPTPSHRLSLALSPYLHTPHIQPPASAPTPLPLGHHLVYFPPPLSEDLLLTDGSDATQAPGGPWTQRMWAGGSLHFPPRPLHLFDSAVLHEHVESVQQRGHNLFVYFNRSIVAAEQPALVERRCLVFMPNAVVPAPRRVLKPAVEAEFGETFVPTQVLLNRFSALTANDHRIHIDEAYARDVEGWRATVCHGPLALVFLMELLAREMKRKGSGARVKAFEYRCLAPMFVGERYRIAGRWKERGSVELWVETPEGGLAVRGIAELEEV